MAALELGGWPRKRVSGTLHQTLSEEILQVNSRDQSDQSKHYYYSSARVASTLEKKKPQKDYIYFFFLACEFK